MTNNSPSLTSTVTKSEPSVEQVIYEVIEKGVDGAISSEVRQKIVDILTSAKIIPEHERTIFDSILKMWGDGYSTPLTKDLRKIADSLEIINQPSDVLHRYVQDFCSYFERITKFGKLDTKTLDMPSQNTPPDPELLRALHHIRAYDITWLTNKLVKDENDDDGVSEKMVEKIVKDLEAILEHLRRYPDVAGEDLATYLKEESPQLQNDKKVHHTLLVRLAIELGLALHKLPSIINDRDLSKRVQMLKRKIQDEIAPMLLAQELASGSDTQGANTKIQEYLTETVFLSSAARERTRALLENLKTRKVKVSTQEIQLDWPHHVRAVRTCKKQGDMARFCEEYLEALKKGGAPMSDEKRIKLMLHNIRYTLARDENNGLPRARIKKTVWYLYFAIRRDFSDLWKQVKKTQLITERKSSEQGTAVTPAPVDL